MKRVTVAILSLLVMAGLMIGTHAPNALAITLVVGASPVALPGSPGNGDNIIASEYNVAFAPVSGLWSGLLSALVVQESNGNLDFYYQITNNITSSSSFSRTTDYIFTGYTADVYYRNDGATLGSIAGTVIPSTADRYTSDTVGFNFTGGLLAGQTTVWFFIATDATAYTIGYTSLIDGGTADVLTFQPIPLPATALLLGTGLLGLVGLGYRRRKAGAKI